MAEPEPGRGEGGNEPVLPNVSKLNYRGSEAVFDIDVSGNKKEGKENSDKNFISRFNYKQIGNLETEAEF